jgi:hypothetical protein
VTFDNFNFAENCKSKTRDIPEDVTVWDDNCPHIAVSADGIDIAAYFPNAVKPAAQASVVFLQFLTVTHIMTEDDCPRSL